ncbi:uncharacterized protein CXQ87_003991 [Candidozyma duobushaemuli]|uniref:TAP42-like protein n=2 Tax=Candidozyma TaxID=3303203 RepID=A0ABX8I9N9_9ASCO|nr:uncharacterized protein CXQ87_003991 [[Candida] duobushaemulonis]PVH16127.1 hypothetical protein CXQ87_003991 [[Candida] duobushaemulonis]QWU89198.1 hypothetical protein CA3LBN_003521 [[Candida] haemuloni]
MSSDLSVKERFKAAVNNLKSLQDQQNLPNENNAILDALNKLKAEFLLIKRMVNHLDLFDKSESFEEISTAYIPYLALEYFIACVEMEMNGHYSPSNGNDNLGRQKKLDHLSSAKKGYQSYLETLDFHGSILSEDDIPDFWDKFKKNHESTANPHEQRQAKIKRFRRRKQLEAQIEVQSEKLEGLDLESQSEEDLRMLYKTELCLFALHSSENLISIQLESSLLETQYDEGLKTHHKSNAKVSNSRDIHSRVEVVPGKKKAISDIIGPKGKILQPFVITKNKAELRKSVFGTGQTLPSMTVDEYLDYELSHGKLLSADDTRRAESSSENSDDELEARAWDDWKDDHPKGSGNMGSNIG